MIDKRLLTGILVGATLIGTAACDSKGLGYGDPNSIIAVMSPERWEEVRSDVYSALETTVFTVAEENEYTVTYQEPYAEYWTQLRRFRQMLLVGTLSDPWVQEAIDEAREPITEPGIYQIREVWALDQTVTLVVLPDSGGNEALRRMLPDVHELLDEQYQNYARNRMYMSGIDTALADTLSAEAGFSFLLPEVYRWQQINDSMFVFRNDNPDPSELIREVFVTWASPALTSLDADGLLEWRQRLVDSYYNDKQVLREGQRFVETEPFLGHEALRVQAQWQNAPDLNWPAGGPFITYAITCANQDRTYFVDAWLYAPGKEKYEYMIQLETILGTFECE
ncbi:MAG: DUF4837 family protein [Gemmatimonadota bacterium]|jgi:hypothetical protein